MLLQSCKDGLGCYNNYNKDLTKTLTLEILHIKKLTIPLKIVVKECRTNNLECE